MFNIPHFRHLREAHRLSIEEVSKIIAVSPASYQRFENSKSQLQAHQLILLMLYYRIPASELVLDKHYQRELRTMERRLAFALMKELDSGKDKVIAGLEEQIRGLTAQRDWYREALEAKDSGRPTVAAA